MSSIDIAGGSANQVGRYPAILLSSYVSDSKALNSPPEPQIVYVKCSQTSLDKMLD